MSYWLGDWLRDWRHRKGHPVNELPERCTHRSHRLRLRCWRWAIYDHQCAKHNRTCFHECKTR